MMMMMMYTCIVQSLHWYCNTCLEGGEIMTRKKQVGNDFENKEDFHPSVGK